MQKGYSQSPHFVNPILGISISEKGKDRLGRSMQNPAMPKHPTHRLRELRDAAGLTQEAAAEHFGLSTSGYNKIERGERRLTADHINRARALYGSAAQIIVSDPENIEATNLSRATGATRHNPALMNRELLLNILVKIDEKRRIDKIRLGGKEPETFAQFVSDLYDMAQNKDGSFESIAHFFDLTPDDENGE